MAPIGNQPDQPVNPINQKSGGSKLSAAFFGYKGATNGKNLYICIPLAKWPLKNEPKRLKKRKRIISQLFSCIAFPAPRSPKGEVRAMMHKTSCYSL